MIVVEQSCVRRLLFAVKRVEGGSVDKVYVEPAVVVIVDEPHA